MTVFISAISIKSIGLFIKIQPRNCP